MLDIAREEQEDNRFLNLNTLSLSMQGKVTMHTKGEGAILTNKKKNNATPEAYHPGHVDLKD